MTPPPNSATDSSTPPTSTAAAAWSAEEYRERTGKALLPPHHALLVASGISLGVAAERGYYSATTKVGIAELGFAASQQRPPALVVPLWSVDGEVAFHQLRPDDPRHSTDGRLVKYETPRGAGLRLDVHPRMQQFLGDPERPLFLTEGIRKVDAAVTADLCCLGLLGVSGWRGRNQDGGVTALADWEQVAHKGRPEFVVFDSDVMTKMPVYLALLRLRTWLESKGADVLVVYLPSGVGGVKVGLDDYLATGHSVDELLALATRVVIHPDSTEPGAQVWHVGEYSMNAVHGTFRRTLEGESRKLANFCARITRKSFDEDGDPLTQRSGAEDLEAIRYAIEVQKGDRHAVIEVTGSEFRAMAWPARVRSLDLVVAAGLPARDQLREAIELVSGEVARQRGLDLIPRSTTFIHAGWTKAKVDGGQIYLHAGGAIGESGLLSDVKVRLPVELAGYKLPAPPDGEHLIEAVQASLALLDLGPDKLIVPVLGAVYRAPLGSADFAEHLHGATGRFKTAVAEVALAHFCECQTSRDLEVISWYSTGNSVEALLHVVKDSLTVVDDLLPAGLSPRERDSMLGTAARVFRAQGNRGGRSRMRADSSIRPPLAPRGLVLSTGEELPRGLSGIARVWLIEQRAGDVTPDALTLAQSRSPLYSLAMAGYLRWLAPQMPEMATRIRKDRDLIRGAYPSGHRRTSEIAAHLEFGWKVFLEFAVSCKAASAQEAAEILARVRSALLEGCWDQVEEQSGADPVELYRNGLQAAISSGRAYVEGRDGEPPPDPGSWGWVPREVRPEPGERVASNDVSWEPANRQGRVGWLDGGDLYLLPEPAFKGATAQVDGGLGIGQAALNKRLRDDGHLASTGEGRNVPVRAPRAIDATRPRVLHFPLSFFVGPVGPVGPEPLRRGGWSSGGDSAEPSGRSDFDSASRTSRTTSGPEVGPFGPAGPTSPLSGPTCPSPGPTMPEGETGQFPISKGLSRDAAGPTGPTCPTQNRRGLYRGGRVPGADPDPEPEFLSAAQLADDPEAESRRP